MKETTKAFITDYDYVEDTLYLDYELQQHGFTSEEFELDGMDGYVNFLLGRISEIERTYNSVNYPWGIMQFIHEYVEKNIEKWKRELRGEKLYKVKVVVEVDIESPWKLDEVVKEVQHRLDVGLDGTFQNETHTIINAIGKEVNE